MNESDDKEDQTKEEINGQKTKRGFTGFFKKVSIKKSIDNSAKVEEDAKPDSTPLEPNAAKSSNDNPSTTSDKERTDEEGITRVSFFQKIGLAKKTADEPSSIEKNTEKDNSVNQR